MAFLGRGEKTDLLKLCVELVVETVDGKNVGVLKNLVLKSKGYEEEFTQNLNESIMESRIEQESNLREEELRKDEKILIEKECKQRIAEL